MVAPPAQIIVRIDEPLMQRGIIRAKEVHVDISHLGYDPSIQQPQCVAETCSIIVIMRCDGTVRKENWSRLLKPFYWHHPIKTGDVCRSLCCGNFLFPFAAVIAICRASGDYLVTFKCFQKPSNAYLSGGKVHI